jgi:hypothetical protein
MGREVRQVPLGWQHPRAENKNEPFMMDGRLWQIKPECLAQYKPMFDQTLKEAQAEWDAAKKKWRSKANKAERDRVREKYGKMTFAEWHGDRPTEEDTFYRPEWPSDAVMGYCFYETTSEGTPLSPVFATIDELDAWLVSEGYDKGAVKRFLKAGWAPTFAEVDGQFVDNVNIHALADSESEA